jgi:Zn-dependent metalloprotease
MRVRRYQAGFVPPFVIQNLALAGIDEARVTAHESEKKRTQRTAKAIAVEVFAVPTPSAAGTAARQVYDSQNSWAQRVKLVRGEGDPSVADKIVNKVYDHAEVVKKYYKKTFARNSIDNMGMNLILNMHYGVKYMNAFWDGDEMTFGDGDGKIFVNFAESLDVVAHELAHGVTQFMADLDYYSQSGALNEHFSDVFGTAITQYALKQNAGKADWLIGDEIMGPDLFGEALRSMREPGTAYDNPLLGKDPQPAHMKDYYAGQDDNQGVHINSGIPNKAFYLTSMEIGTDKAALIWYNALGKMWPTITFNEAVKVIVESTRILVRDGKVPLGSTQRVRAAFKAVGLPT